MDFKELFRSLDPEMARFIPRSGNVFVDSAVRYGFHKLIKAYGAQPGVEGGEFPQQQEDPREAANTLIRKIVAQNHGIYVIGGPRGSGKSSLTVYLAQCLRRPTFSINFPGGMSWITEIEPAEIERIPNGSTVLLDDTGLVFGSRDYQSKVADMLHELIVICRHRELVLIANTGVTSLIDKYLLDCDGIFLKRPNLLTMEIERAGLRRVLQRALDAFEQMGLEPEQEKGYVYCFSDPHRFHGMLWYPLPDGYDARISQNKRFR